MSASLLKTKIIYAVRTEAESGITLVIASTSSSRQGKIIEQIAATDTDFVFEVQQKVVIDTDNILEQLEIRCLEDQNRYLIPSEEYHLIINEINKNDNFPQTHRRESEDSEFSNSDYGEHRNPRKRNFVKMESYNEESYNNQENQHRGRGRPKGSKNKKTIMKENQPKNDGTIQLKFALTGRIKRGKGRPKGSKNKVKIIKIDYRDVKADSSEALPFGKRGKGRPKGSKNKVKQLHSLQDQQMDTADKKKRGRPPGAKNRVPNSIESFTDKDESEQGVQVYFQRPKLEEIEAVECCSRCKQKSLKRKIFQGEIQTVDKRDVLRNVSEDFGLENKTNLIVTTIRIGDWETLETLLEIVDQRQTYVMPPWPVEKAIERGRFSVKTKKEQLSKTNKEGNLALLHDVWKKKQEWWKEISLERIIQNLPRSLDEVEEIFEKLFTASLELKQQLFANVASVIRSGNCVAASKLLSQILTTENPQSFLSEHLEVLKAKVDMLNQFKKCNLLRANEGVNYCSPIHAAAISNNSSFLRRLLSVFTDVMHVTDSELRKPVHYAALSNTQDNLAVLFEIGVDLKEFDRRKITPLMLACCQGLVSNVMYILEKVRDSTFINYKSDEGYNALHYAVFKGQVDCVEQMINDPYVDIWSLTKDNEDIFHLMAGTGNTEILSIILDKQYRPSASEDKFKRTPAMVAIRNNNNEFLHKILEAGCKLDKQDSSHNSLLHYAAAYGNVEAILMLRQYIPLSRNKHGLYPCEIAILKGHIGSAKLLHDSVLEYNEDPMFLALSNIRGSQDYFKCIEYISEDMMEDVHYQDKYTGNGYLHLVCGVSVEDYVRARKSETWQSQEELVQQFSKIQKRLIDFFLGLQLTGHEENKKKQSPLKVCIENNNLIGFHKLFKGKANFEIESSSGNTAMHCLSHLACKGSEEMRFVLHKFKEALAADLKIHLKKLDNNGFDFFLYFVKQFTDAAKHKFSVMLNLQKASLPTSETLSEQRLSKHALEAFRQYQFRFIEVIEWLIQIGCDVNAFVIDRKKYIVQSYNKWGIQHFLMSFPSLRLVKFFKGKIRDFNAQNNYGMTPLHLFSSKTKDPNLLGTTLAADYNALEVLEYLLSNGCNPNCLDISKAMPIHYAAKNNQLEFIVSLRKHKSQINICSQANQVPLVEFLKSSKQCNLQKVTQLLKLGADPNFTDNDKRTALHHLVHGSQSVDEKHEVCKLFLQSGAKVNALDKYDRSPIFYCFIQMNPKAEKSDQKEANEKLEILQILIRSKDINLNLADVYHRTLLHYACEGDYFFSIMYLLDSNMNSMNSEAKDIDDNTPLAVCLKNNKIDQAMLLIKKGVLVGYVNDGKERQSYFTWALKQCSVGLCFLLLDNGYPLDKALQESSKEAFKKILLQKYAK